MNKMVFASLMLIASALTIALTLTNLPASALSGSDFKPGRIIDDVVFYNSSSMSPGQIQNFLNSKLANCDTGGNGMASEWGYPNTQRKVLAERFRTTGVIVDGKLKVDPGFHAPPYTCLKDFRADTPQIGASSGYCGSIPAKSNQTAAQMIYDISQACGINPQVLLVLLDKEQSLVTDIWPLNRQYRSATGFACPDTADCNPAYAGLFQQLYNAGKQFKIYQANPNHSDFNYRAGRTQRIYYQTNLGGFINPTGNASDASRNGHNGACGYSNIYIENQATAALYIYTPYQPNQNALNNLRGTGDACSAYGNRNFWRMFNDWFGSTLAVQQNKCDSRVSNVVCIWSVIKQDGSQFLTSSDSEMNTTVRSLGWSSEGIAFHAYNTQVGDSIPMYRLRNEGLHIFTEDSSEYENLKKQNGWIDEGVAFYVLRPNTSNSSHKISRLKAAYGNISYLTKSGKNLDDMIARGYALSPASFNTPSGSANLSNATHSGRTNIFSSSRGNAKLYTTSLHELESAISSGYTYDGVLATSELPNAGTPIYRLRISEKYLYTSSISEKNLAVSKYGYTDEGIGFYIDNTTDQIYRMANRNSDSYTYTSSIDKLMSTVNKGGWTYEGYLINKPASEVMPVYRFLNKYNSRHFYTIDLNEAIGITNGNWIYETIAFSTNRNSGSPIYRLLLNDKHFYTANKDEHDLAISRYKYISEGVAFYANDNVTEKPVYRLQGGNDEYFYTASSKERDSAVSKYRYTYEGEGFYLPVGN